MTWKGAAPLAWHDTLKEDDRDAAFATHTPLTTSSPQGTQAAQAQQREAGRLGHGRGAAAGTGEGGEGDAEVRVVDVAVAIEVRGMNGRGTIR